MLQCTARSVTVPKRVEKIVVLDPLGVGPRRAAESDT